MNTYYQSLKNKTALVTGGSRGIGRATCEMLAEQGVSIILQYNTSVSAASELVKSIEKKGGLAYAIQADLNNDDDIKRLINQCHDKYNSIDILINNAGEMTHEFVVEMSDEMWDKSLRLHLTAAFQLTRAFAPTMMSNKWGRVINIASQVIFTGSAKHAHYSAAKSGILGFTYSLVKELGDSGVTANVISPGRIKTDLIIPHIENRKEEWMKQTPMKRFGEPEEIADVILFLASDKSSYITGANINVNGGQVMG